MVAPSAGARRPHPIIKHLEERGWLPPDEAGERMTTESTTIRELRSTLLYLRRSRAVGQDAAAALAQADRSISNALHRVGASSRFELLSWRDQYTSDKNIKAFGEKLASAIRASIPYRFIIKQYLSGGRPDTEKTRRIGTLKEELYYARESDPRVPAAPISAYTNEYLLSLRTDRNLAYDVLPTTPADQHAAIADELDLIVDGFLAYLAGRPELTESTEPERIQQKFAACVQSIAVRAGAMGSIDRLLAESQQVARAVIDEGLVVPHLDPKTPNFIQEEDGTLRLVDMDNAVTIRTSRDVLRAHVAFDPLLELPMGERLARVRSIETAIFYTTYRSTRAIERRENVPFAQWRGAVMRRAQGHIGNWQSLCALPEVRSRYPTIADLAVRARELGIGAHRSG